MHQYKQNMLQGRGDFGHLVIGAGEHLSAVLIFLGAMKRKDTVSGKGVRGT